MFGFVQPQYRPCGECGASVPVSEEDTHECDLQRWLDDKPIAAKPPNLLDRIAKWRRRNRGLVAAASILLLLASI